MSLCLTDSFKPTMPFTAADIAIHLQGEVVGDSTTPLTGFASAEGAKPGDLTFAENGVDQVLQQHSASQSLTGTMNAAGAG